MALRHLVLFHIRPGTPNQAVRQAFDGLRPLGHLPGILEWRVEMTLDLRKGPVIVENALFTDAAALEAFRVAPEHAESAARLAAIADWVVGDYEE